MRGKVSTFQLWIRNTWMYLGVAEGAGVVERYQTAMIPGMDVGAVLEEEVHHVFTAKAWRRRERHE